MKIKIPDLDKLITEVLRTEYTKEESDLIKDIVLFGELSGRPSHGILRLIKGNYGVFVDGERGKPEYIHKTMVSTLIDSKRNSGMLIGPLAMGEAMRLAKEHGIGIVGTKGSFNSIGSLTYYCEKIARNNFIVVMFAQAMPQTAPFNTKKALFGSNPIAFGIPSDQNPLIFDMSTTSATYGTLMKYSAEGVQLPPDIALDKDGNRTTDPTKALKGATLPFDASYKGSGLAMMVEILASLWSGGSYEGLHYDADGWGNLFMVFSPDLMSDTETMKMKVKEFIETLRNAPTRDGKPVRIPGEHTLAVRDMNVRAGEIEVSDVILGKIKAQMR
jgi:LDH2 family malate/lactate/ureidoglycolate dehydrogenase